MVASVSTTDAPRLIASPGLGADGVVRLKLGDSAYGSGVLLYDGRHILTARHLLYDAGTSSSVFATFETVAGTQTLAVTAAQVMKSWSASSLQGDLMLLTLNESAPVSAPRYEIYRAGNEVGQAFTMVGYGLSGTGGTGKSSEPASTTLRRYAENRFDGEMSALKSVAGELLGWTPPKDSQLWADFDNGLAAQDATRLWTGQADPGRGSKEGLITPGDSGSPAFIGGKVAGIASYTFSSAAPSGRSDIDGTSNSSFGEVAAWQRVSHYQQWIDQALRSAYPNAPTKPEEVKKAVAEGNSGTSYAYFLLELADDRTLSSEPLSVKYQTRDGSAKAGEDYLAVGGTLLLYPGERHAVIPVEIIGDSRKEPVETFYLDVTEPVNGSFGDGVITLTAVRTILNDDGAIV